MNSTLLKPIGRRTYFWGIVVLAIVSSVLNFSGFLFNMSNKGLQNTEMLPIGMLPLTLLLGAVFLLWDYKRIKDISSDPIYLFLLFIPAAYQLTSVFLNNPSADSWLVSSQADALDSPLVIARLLLTLLTLIVFLFLFFKKGSSSNTPIVSA